MGFQGYKLRYKLAIFHNSEDASASSGINVRNMEMNIFILSDSTKFYRFEEMEKQVAMALERFSGRPIEEIHPFNTIEPTLENIGVVFFELLQKGFLILGAPVDRLEISENLIRTFIVTEADNKHSLVAEGKKVKIIDLIMADYISGSISSLISDVDTPDASSIKETKPEEIQSDQYNNYGAVDPGKDHRLTIDEVEEEVKDEVAVAFDAKGFTADKNDRIGSKRFIPILSAMCTLIAVGMVLCLYLYNQGLYPSGADIYGHLFKSDLLYNSMRQGDFYPLYTDLWYNGVQPFRYWAPLPYYILALLQFIAGGNALLSYLLFVGFAMVVGGAGWILWGVYYDRLFLCTFLALMWFFLPDNMRVFFVEGNLPRMVIAIFLPYIFFYIWRFVDHRKKKACIPILLIMCAIILCHVMIAAMIGISTFIFLLLYSISQKRVRESFFAICLMLVSFALCGPWLYPALQGGLVSMDASATAEVMKALSTPAVLSLNPFLRGQGMHEIFYFGISIFILSIFGFIFSGKKSRPGFTTVILVFIGTLPVMVTFLDKLPLNQLLWMTRFTPIVYAIFLLSLLEWDKLKRYVIIILVLILIFDSVPSLNFHRYYSLKPGVLSYSINEGKKIVDQRMTLMDLSVYGSYPSFGISSEDPKTPYTFGWAWQGASTAYNIMMKNTALERGYYVYLFDRCLELGDDIVMIQKQQIELAKQQFVSLLDGAAASNYFLAKETNDVYIFKRNAADIFGTITDYRGLTIGRSANLIALEYPLFEEGMEDDVTKYSIDDLKKYDVVYLSGFTYKDKNSAEELLTKAAFAGVKIIIDMNRIPSDSVTNRMSFMGVNAQPVGFTDRFPEMIYKGAVYEPLPFMEGFKEWNTVYLENLDEAIAYSWIGGKLLPFVGSKNHENVIMLGYNILFHGMETKDEAVISLISDITGFGANRLPVRKIVPLNINYERNKIIIKSFDKGVNTTLGFQDVFQSSQRIESKTNLLIVGKGNTEIKIVYPYLKEGIILCLIGIIAASFIIRAIYRKGDVKNEKRSS